MTTIITRKAIEQWSGTTPDPDLAYLVNGRKITWAEVMEKRRNHQRLRLARKRESSPAWRAAYLEVGYYGMGLMGGWQAMLYWIGGHCWIDRDGKNWRDPLQRLFPCNLFLDWEEWKPLFAKRYARRRQLRRSVGIAFLWMRRYELSLSCPRRKPNVINQE